MAIDPKRPVVVTLPTKLDPAGGCNTLQPPFRHLGYGVRPTTG